MSEPGETLLDVREVSRLFDVDGAELRAVDAASLQVSAGEVVVINGASGSGKTTLMMMAAGMLRPSAGEIRLMGRDPYQMNGGDSAALRAGFLGVVLPMFHLLPYLDAADNVALGYRGAGGRTKAIASIAAIGLAGRERQLPDRMSAGERRRLIVARALLHEPKLILADEPTANLDEANASEIAAMLKARAVDGAGVLLITHESSQRFEADRVFTMESGRLTPVSVSLAS